MATTEHLSTGMSGSTGSCPAGIGKGVACIRAVGASLLILSGYHSAALHDHRRHIRSTLDDALHTRVEGPTDVDAALPFPREIAV
jgi:hypothetical protein